MLLLKHNLKGKKNYFSLKGKEVLRKVLSQMFTSKGVPEVQIT